MSGGEGASFGPVLFVGLIAFTAATYKAPDIDLINPSDFMDMTDANTSEDILAATPTIFPRVPQGIGPFSQDSAENLLIRTASATPDADPPPPPLAPERIQVPLLAYAPISASPDLLAADRFIRARIDAPAPQETKVAPDAAPSDFEPVSLPPLAVPAILTRASPIDGGDVIQTRDLSELTQLAVAPPPSPTTKRAPEREARDAAPAAIAPFTIPALFLEFESTPVTPVPRTLDPQVLDLNAAPAPLFASLDPAPEENPRDVAPAAIAPLAFPALSSEIRSKPFANLPAALDTRILKLARATAPDFELLIPAPKQPPKSSTPTVLPAAGTPGVVIYAFNLAPSSGVYSPEKRAAASPEIEVPAIPFARRPAFEKRLNIEPGPDWRAVTGNRLRLRTGPGLDQPIKDWFYVGDHVVVVDSVEGWALIRRPNDPRIDGWVSTKYLLRVSDFPIGP